MKFLDILNLRIRGYTTEVEIGDCYYYGKHVTKDITTALKYYHNAAKNNNHKAYSRLSDIARSEGRQGEADYYAGKTFELMELWNAALEYYSEAAKHNYELAFFQLAILYQKDRIENRKLVIKKNSLLEIKWLRKAIAAGNEEALKVLENKATEEGAAAFQLAEMYRLGEVNKRPDIGSAMHYYEVAKTKHDIDAMFTLGQINEFGQGIGSRDLLTSYNNYLAPAKKGHQDSLAGLIRVIALLNDEKYELALAEIYLNDLNDKVSAAKCYKSLVEKDYSPALIQLEQLIVVDAEYAFELASLYHADEKYFPNHCHAYYYYSVAARGDHPLAINILIDLISTETVYPHFYLGFVYYHQSKWRDAITCYEKAAAKDHIESMRALAEIYQTDRVITENDVIKKDLSVELHWYRKAAALGDSTAFEIINTMSETESEAAIVLAEMYKLGEIDNTPNILLAIQQYENAKTMHDNEAIFQLGKIYEIGEMGVSVDLVASYNNYLIAAKDKHRDSFLGLINVVNLLNENQYKQALADIHLEVFNDKVAALTIYKSLVEQKFPGALARLNEIVHGDAECALQLAKLYHNDECYFPASWETCFYYCVAGLANNVQAKMILMKLANEQDIYALYYFAFLCRYQNEWDLAIDYFEKAANKNDIASMRALAEIYQEDRYISKKESIKKDLEKELKWYRKAAAVGDKESLEKLHTMSNTEPKAAIVLAEMYKSGEIDNEPNFALAIELYEKAKAMHSIEAIYQLGKIYEYGEMGVSINLVISYDNYLFAAKNKHYPSLEGLIRVILVLKNDQHHLTLADVYLTCYKDIMSAVKTYKFLIDKNNSEASGKVVTIAVNNAEFAFELAQSYHNDKRYFPKDWHAYFYYSLAAGNNHQKALDILISLMSQDNINSLYYLARAYHNQFKWREAIQYYEQAAEKNDTLSMFALASIYLIDRVISVTDVIKSDLMKVLNWYRKAAALGHQKSLDELKILSNTQPKAAIILAQMYECGEIDAKKDIHSAILCYKKASDLNDIDASYKLGQIYELGQDDLVIDLNTSYNYYYHSAKLKNKLALEALAKLLENSDNDFYIYSLGEIYYTYFNNSLEALKIYKKLADKEFDMAVAKLKVIINNNENLAYQVAELYRNDGSIKTHAKRVYSYYIIAALKGNNNAFTVILDLANDSDADAQYALAFEYYLKKKDMNNTINWIMRAADARHAEAKEYLLKTNFSIEQFLSIAKKYDLGTEGVAKNSNLAIIFYQKANSKDKDVIFRTAELLQAKLDTSLITAERDYDSICQYYITAALNGRRDALTPLERLGEECSVEMKLKLAVMYRDLPFRDILKAKKWFTSAAEDGSTEAKTQLNALQIKSGSNASNFFEPPKSIVTSSKSIAVAANRREF